MVQLLALDWTYRVARITGFAFLAGFLFFSDQHAFSIIGVIGYVLITLIVSFGMVGLKLAERFPEMNRYRFIQVSKNDEARPLSEKEWGARRAEYLESSLRGMAIFLTPAEDGLICVPVLLVGVNMITAVLGGLAFGLLHLGRFTYLECVGKTVIYSLAILLILPQGLLTLIAGHFTVDIIGLLILKIARRRLRSSP